MLVLDLVFPVRLWYHGICGICGSGIGCETVSWIVCVCGSWDSRSVYPVLACSSRECAVCACPGPPAPAGVFEPRNCSGSLLRSVQFSYFTAPPRAYVAAVACACACASQPRGGPPRPKRPHPSELRALDYQQRYSCAARFAKRKTTDIIRIEALQIVIRVSFARIPHDTALSRNIQL